MKDIDLKKLVKWLEVRKSLTQKKRWCAVAKEIGVDQVVFTRIRRHGMVPNGDNLFKILCWLDVPLARLTK